MPNNFQVVTRNLLYFMFGPSSANCDAFMTMLQKGDVEHVFICNCIGTLKLQKMLRYRYRPRNSMSPFPQFTSRINCSVFWGGVVHFKDKHNWSLSDFLKKKRCQELILAS